MFSVWWKAQPYPNGSNDMPLKFSNMTQLLTGLSKFKRTTVSSVLKLKEMDNFIRNFLVVCSFCFRVFVSSLYFCVSPKTEFMKNKNWIGINLKRKIFGPIPKTIPTYLKCKMLFLLQTWDCSTIFSAKRQTDKDP